MLKISFKCLRNSQSLKLLQNVNNSINASTIKCLSLTYNRRNIQKNDEEEDNSQKLTDQDYLVRLKNDPDMFGPQVKEEIVDELDLKEEQFLTYKPTGKRLSIKQYADLIKGYINKRQIKEAIDVIELRMLKEDGVKPDKYLYNLLIGACGRVGYTNKAFQLFNELKRRGLQIHPGTYTGLFNACANSPFPEDGLKRTKHLHNLMIEKLYEPNDSNYNAMIKAYGRCGDLKSAFALVDEMQTKKFLIKDDTLNFLLQACINDKEAGFRHALLVWRKFIEKRIAPSIFTYNLFLRSIRDCGLGDLEATHDVIKRILPPTDRYLQLESSMNELEVVSNSLVDTRPNLMMEVPHLGTILELKQIEKAEDRLLLVGGAKSFLDNMKEHSCKPNIKTFTQLLDCIPNTLIAENELLQSMKLARVKPDLDFYNMLIKKRSMRFDYASARDVLELLKVKFRPNLITYGVLSLGCKTKEDAEDLLEEMNSAKYIVNAEILGAMLQQACHHNNFSYILMIMELLLKEDIKANKMFMEHLEKFKSKCKKFLDDKDHAFNKNKAFIKGFMIFKLRYKTWKDEVQIEENLHPWQQYRQDAKTDVRHYKDKERWTRFKPRHISHFRVKTSPKYTQNDENSKKIVKFVKRNNNKQRLIKDNKEDEVYYKKQLQIESGPNE